MPYNVKVQPSGLQFTVGPGETVLDAAERQNIALPYGCRDGLCGGCIGRLLSGAVSYGGALPQGLTADEERQGLALFCQARPLGNLVIEAPRAKAQQDMPAATLPCRVARMELLAPDVMVLYLKLTDAPPLRFRAGQYLDIVLKDGKIRSFSIANAPHNSAFLELHVRMVKGGAFTPRVFNEMKLNALLHIHGPLGSFYLREDSPRPVLLMGGGTGFAPLKGIIEHALRTGFKPPLHLYWGARAQCDLYQDTLARTWARQQTRFRYTPVLSAPLPEDNWSGGTGFVHEAVVRDYPDLSGHDVYMSGPPPMIAAARRLFRQHGLPDAQLLFDSFEFTPAKKTGIGT